MPDQPLSRSDIRALQSLSPFELKEKLREIAGQHEGSTAFQQLNAGRGNPNFTAPTPREAFFRLGLFALQECRDAVTFRDWLDGQPDDRGIDMLRRVLDWGVEGCCYDPDAFVWELADAVIGGDYPDPDRMLHHVHDVVRRYLLQEMGAGIGPMDLFAVEGGTAAICYVLDSLVVNRLLTRGDRVAVMTPIFTPYLEIAELEHYGFDLLHLRAESRTPDGSHSWQYLDADIDQLRDPAIMVLICVNPTNPPSVSIAPATLRRIADVVADNPDLVVITDDVYGTFIDGFTSLAAYVPGNSVLIYSFSKYFGATGWRLGVIGIHPDNVLDRLLEQLPEDDKRALDARYGSLTLTPREIRFIDRLVADSRSVALNHTAGLSQPQQLMMLLFAAYCLLDTEGHYKQQAQALIQRRLNALLDGMRITLADDPHRVGYYIELDLLGYAEKHYGPVFAAFLQANYEPTDILFRLARQTGVIALNGGGFDGPPWSIRLSIANLRDYEYTEIGRAIRTVAEEYLVEWRAVRGGE
jgi:aspartate 4-decarboxylase